jgi:hypothetical protein
MSKVLTKTELKELLTKELVAEEAEDSIEDRIEDELVKFLKKLEKMLIADGMLRAKHARWPGGLTDTLYDAIFDRVKSLKGATPDDEDN